MNKKSSKTVANVFFEPGSLSGEAMNMAKFAHWVRIACLCGEDLIGACLLWRSYDMGKLFASPLEPTGLG